MRPILKRTKARKVVVGLAPNYRGPYFVVTFPEGVDDATEVSSFSVKSEALTMAKDLARMFPTQEILVGKIFAEVYTAGEEE